MEEIHDDTTQEEQGPSTSTWWPSDFAEKFGSVSLTSRDDASTHKKAITHDEQDELSFETASQILWSTGTLSDPIPNGFYSVAPDKKLKEMFGRLPTLDELSALENDGYRADVILVDGLRDKKLHMLKQLVTALVKGLNSNPAAVIKKIAGLVSDLYKRPNTESSPVKASLEEASLGRGVQLLGQIKHGSCRPRAILFKVLADTVGLESKLVVESPIDGIIECTDSYKHLSVVVMLNSVELLVDLMRFPGQLIPRSTRAIYLTHISAAGESDSAENDSCDSPLEPNSPLYGFSDRGDQDSAEKDETGQFARRFDTITPGPSLQNRMLRSATGIDRKLSEPNIAASFWRHSRRKAIVEPRTASSSPEHPSFQSRGRSMLGGDRKSLRDLTDDAGPSRNPPHPLFKFVMPIKSIFVGTGTCSIGGSTNEKTSSIDPRSLRARQLPLSKDPTLEVYDNESHKIIGRNKEIEHIKLRISDCGDIRGPSVLAVTGMSGIGKTALVKLVYSDMVTYHFDIRLWVTDSSKSIISIPRILRSIIKAGTGEMMPTDYIGELVNKIKHLLHDKRYLLVLDDIWVESKPFWVELKSILDVGKGGVILITTRNHEVAGSAQAVGEYNLKCLPYFDCWSIFKGLAFNEHEEERFPRLCEIGKAVVHKCLGIPLAAACLGRLLQSERDEGKWLRIGNMDFTNSGKDIVTSILKLAYDEFPDHLKRCFAHLALNQGDGHSVGRHQIFFWNALGLLKGPDEKDIERYGQNYLMELLSRCILYDSVRTSSNRIVSCKIHDLWLDLAMEVLGEDLAVITWKELKVSHLSRHLVWGYEEPNALSDKDFPEELINARNAQTFRFSYPMGRINYRFLQGIISNMHNLHILDLGYSYFVELPSSVGDLKHLRVLNLSFNPVIKNLPDTLKSLLHLQALYLEGCKKLKLSQSAVEGLQSLKCFTVTALVLPSINVMLLSGLEELQILSCKEFFSSRGQSNTSYKISLRRLIIHDCPELDCFPDMTQLVCLEELVISNCRNLNLDNRSLNGLNGLQYLEIIGMPSMSRLPSAIQNVANSLQGFVLRDCIKLVEFPNWLCSFSLLRSFVIYGCPSLLTFPRGFHQIKSLMELKIKGCPHLSRWFKTPEGYFLAKRIPQIEIEIDGRLITQIKKEGGKVSSDSRTSGEEMMLQFRLFPDDYEFERETLVQLWMAAGYSREGWMEEFAGIYFDSFINEGRILRAGIESFSGVCRYKINVDKAVNIYADGRYIVLKDEITDAVVNMCQHISVMSSDINHKTFERLKRCHELRTLLFLRNYGPALKQVPSDMFLALQKMESLNLSGSDITELPASIGNVKRLCYLDLSFTLLERLPETIDRLVELRILNLEGCKELYRLPSGMKKLIKLRHLYFDVLGQLNAMPEGIGALTELRTLSAFIVDVKEGCNLRDLKDMNNLRGSCCISGLESVSEDSALICLVHKEYVTKLQLRWDGCGAKSNKDNAEVPMDYLQPHSCLEKLELYCYPNTSLPYWISHFYLPNLTSLTFFKCENITPTATATVGRLLELKYLGIIQMNKVETIEFDYSPKLERLMIDGMCSLSSWKRIPRYCFLHLSELTVKHCPKIKALPGLAALTALEYLEISYCKELEALCDEKLSVNLKTLVIDSCPLLTKRCSKDGEEWFNIQHIPDIWIEQENISSPSEDDSKDGEEGESGDEEAEESESDDEEAKEGESGNEEAEEGKPDYEETEEGELGVKEAEEGEWGDEVAEEGESDDVELNKGASGDKDSDTT